MAQVKNVITANRIYKNIEFIFLLFIFLIVFFACYVYSLLVFSPQKQERVTDLADIFFE